MAAAAQLTPMMAQYRRIKSELPKDALLLFRLGDFYEMFFEDAQVGAALLNLALTARNGVPMCGLPFHAANGYIGRLLRAGRKVAICDQVEEPRPGKLVKREVTQILSPGTHFDEHLLTAERNNYLAAICPGGRHRETGEPPSGDGVGARMSVARYGLALVDLTTGDFKVTELAGDAALLAELERLRPAEIIYPGEAVDLPELLAGRSPAATAAGAKTDWRNPVSSATGQGWILNAYDDWTFAPETAVFTVRDHFQVATLDGFGLRDRPAAVGAAGAALHYLTQHLHRDAKNLTRMTCYERSDFLALDHTTLRHLEILEPLHRDAPRTASLLGVINRTVTPMGARRLRDWLTQPLARVDAIRARQAVVQVFEQEGAGLETFREQLREVRDLERTLGRLSSGSGNARDLAALRTALAQLPALRQTLQSLAGDHSRAAQAAVLLQDAAPPGAPLLTDLTDQLCEAPDLVELLTRAVVDEPPPGVKEGGLIRDGFSPELDELRAAQRQGKAWIAKLQADEIARTGIPSLKVRFNSVFGYYLEVTKANLDKVPPHYVRKQTVANGERFITPELKEMEGKILGAEERAERLEYELFQHLREAVLGQLPVLLQTAAALAQLDVMATFGEVARLHDYCRPHVGDAGVLHIVEGRHPVLEQQLTEERFVPNDTGLESRAGDLPVTAASDEETVVHTTADAAGPRPALPQIALITGPNMAGKSTYIRQVALLTLLAHTGSFIPAREARVDLVDRIFTRIGASDDLARGQSTFMVEMSEAANILHNATPRSLIILDEIGRGTSTFDGLSLAWSIVEHLHNQVGAKTLFATHYHELAELALRLPRLRNFNVAVREWHDQIVFLRKIVEGGSDKSYGLQVARLAGVPPTVVERAKVILANLEESELTPEGNVRRTRRQQDREKLKHLAPAPQMDLFG